MTSIHIPPWRGVDHIRHSYFHDSTLRKITELSLRHIGNNVDICRRYFVIVHGPLTRYAKLRVAHAPRMPRTFSPPPRVSDPDMHHGTCVTYVPWCMSVSLTTGFLWSRWRGNRPRAPGACATHNFAYLSRGPWRMPLQELAADRTRKVKERYYLDYDTLDISKPHREICAIPLNFKSSIKLSSNTKIHGIPTTKWNTFNGISWTV